MRNTIHIPNQNGMPPKVKGTMVHVSVRTNGFFGLGAMRTKGETFRGSIRQQFTGPRRNNFGPMYQ